MLFSLFSDLHRGARAVFGRPTFAAVVMLTLSLGIGANVAIFSLADQILLRPLPVPEPDRLVNLTDAGTEFRSAGRMDPVFPPYVRLSDSGGMDTIFSYPMFRDLERDQESFTGLAAHTFFDATLSSSERATLATGAFVSGSYFPVLGLRPSLGRLLGAEDDGVDGVADSVVLSHAYWQTEFGGDPNVLGQMINVNEVPLTIVGVAPEAFHGTAVSARASVFVPITVRFGGDRSALASMVEIPNHGRRDYYWVHLFGRLKPELSRETAAAALNTLYGAILNDVEAPLLTDIDQQDREAFLARPLVLEPGARGQTNREILSPARNRLGLLFAAGGLVLLLCCANVAGLMLVRATTRSGEMALRASMGATRGRLLSLQLAESVVLAVPAALLALPVAWLTLRGASRVPGIPEAAADVSLSAAATLVAISVAVLTALAAGLLPIRGLFRTDPVKALQGTGARQTTPKAVARFRTTLATAQIALSMALLAMMAVFTQSLSNIGHIDLGADIDSVVMFSIGPGGATGAGEASPRLIEALEAIPGVSSVASSGRPLLSPGRARPNVGVEGVDADESLAWLDVVSSGFFEVFGIETLAGRTFSDSDTFTSGFIVNLQFVEKAGLTPETIIGRRVRGNLPPLEIVGVVADVRSSFEATSAIEPQLYQPVTNPLTGPVFYVRSTLPAEALLSAVRDTAVRVEPTKPITNLRTMEHQFRESIFTERFVAATSTVFALLATGLAALGLYGLLAYSVAQRSREIGLRVALGAPTSRVRGMVLRQVGWMAGIGIALGAIAATVLGRGAQSLLFGVEAGDPLMLAAAAVVLIAVTLGAAYIPARRASRIDPMSVLRYE